MEKKTYPVQMDLLQGFEIVEMRYQSSVKKGLEWTYASANRRRKVELKV